MKKWAIFLTVVLLTTNAYALKTIEPEPGVASLTSHLKDIDDNFVELGTGKQDADSDLDIYAGITPSTDIQSFLGLSDYAAVMAALDGQDRTWTGDLDATGANSFAMGPLDFTSTATAPDTDGQWRYMTSATGITGKVFSFFDSAQKWLLGTDLPTTTGDVPTYNSGTGLVTWEPQSGGAAGYVATPTYSDDTCTAGQYSFDSSYWYTCESTNQWDRFAVTWGSWSNPTPIIPLYSSGAVLAVGNVIEMNFSTAVTEGSGWAESLFTVDGSVTGSDIGMTVTGGDGTTQLTALLDSVLQAGETVTLTYAGATDGLESSTGDDLVTFTGSAVTNNSEYSGAITYAIEENLEGTGYDGALTPTEVTGSGGTVDEDYTTIALKGSQSLNLIGGSDLCRIQFTLSSDVANFSYCTMFRINALPTNTVILFHALDSATSKEYKIGMTSTGLLTVDATGASQAYGPTLSADTTYYIWVDGAKGTGSDASIALSVGTTASKPVTPDTTISNSTITADMRYIRAGGGYSGNFIYDQILMSETEFTTVP